MHSCIHAFMYSVFMYSCIHVFIYSCIHIFMYSCMYVFMYSCIGKMVFSCIHVFMYSCIHVIMSSRIHVFMYSYIHVFLYSCINYYVRDFDVLVYSCMEVLVHWCFSCVCGFVGALVFAGGCRVFLCLQKQLRDDANVPVAPRELDSNGDVCEKERFRRVLAQSSQTCSMGPPPALQPVPCCRPRPRLMFRLLLPPCMSHPASVPVLRSVPRHGCRVSLHRSP